MGEAVRVLHVDDDPDFVDLTATHLQREDDRIDVVTENDPEDALDRVADDDIDCIVSDYDMPGMDGLAFLRAVREDDPDLPFILFTGKGGEEVASEAIAAGATDYLQKKSGTEQYELLAARIVNAVTQYRSQQRAAKLDRAREIASSVNQALVRATSREEIERESCRLLTTTGQYGPVAITDADGERERLEIRAVSGEATGEGDVPVRNASGELTPPGRAVGEREMVVDRSPGAPSGASWLSECGSVAAVPLTYGDDLYGLLVVCHERADGFDDSDRELLAELGADIAHAIHTREVQRQLREERALTESIFATLPDVLYAFDDQLNFLRWNDRLSDVTGYTDDEIAEMGPSDLVSEGEEATVNDTIETVVSERRPVSAELPLQTKDGEEIPYEWTANVMTDQDGEVVGVTGIGRDVSERKERERALRRSRARLRTLIDNLPFPVYVVDEDGTYLVANPELAELHGLTVEAVEGSTVGEILDPASAEQFREDMEAVLESGEPRTIPKVTIPDAQGEERILRPRMLPFDFDDVEGRAVLGMAIDITDQERRRQELERKNERLDEFVSVVSHDLRNPLNVAVGRLELVASECDSEHIEAVADAHRRMEQLIDDLMALAQQGAAATDREPVDLETVVRQCWGNVETGGATLAVETDQTVRADRGRLKQLLENLVTNAVEHGSGDDREDENGSVTVTVGDLEDEDGFYLADDGPGIPPDEREKVFEAGYSTGDDGTGFGLSIVEQIVDSHGWSVRVTESADDGARFEIVTDN
ncbi:MAG: PAS domain S-box protein [Haloarculaceae archaeon]